MPEKEAKAEVKVSVESPNLGQKRGNGNVSIFSEEHAREEITAEKNIKLVKMGDPSVWSRDTPEV